MYTNYYDVSMFAEPSFYIGTLIFAGIAYLIGSINAGQILSIMGSKDLGQEGSRNFGATNAGRVYGAKGFAAVFIFDMLKSVAAAIILALILTQGTMSYEHWADQASAYNVENNSVYFFHYASIPLAMVWVIIGHSFPVYFGFKGGKGVASVFGCIIALNWVFAIASILVFAATIIITRWTSLGSIFGTIFGVCLVLFLQPIFYEYCGVVLFFWSNSWLNIFAALFLGIFITYRHRSNIIRMAKGIDPFMKPKGWKPADATPATETKVEATGEQPTTNNENE